MHDINTHQKTEFGRFYKTFKISLDILHPSSHNHHIARKFLQKQKRKHLVLSHLLPFFINLLIYIYTISNLISRLYL